MSLCVLIYDVQITKSENGPSSYAFNYERQVTLMKNQFKPFVKDKLSENFVSTQAQWATNGNILLYFSVKGKVISFDLATGKKTSKCKYWDSCEQFQMIYFNYLSGNFVRMLTRDHSSEASKYWVFNYSNFHVSSGENIPKIHLNKIRSALTEGNNNEEPLECVKSLNVVKNLMKKSRPQKVSTNAKTTASAISLKV